MFNLRIIEQWLGYTLKSSKPLITLSSDTLDRGSEPKKADIDPVFPKLLAGFIKNLQMFLMLLKTHVL